MNKIDKSFFDSVNPDIPPWEHQIEGVNRAINSEGGFGFFFEMGTGKTRTLVTTLRYRYCQNQNLLRTLIVCPVAVLENIKREILKFSKVKEEDIVILYGSEKKRLAAFSSTLDSPKIYITNYEAFGRMKDFKTKLSKNPPDILVLDEAHRCKSPLAKSSKFLYKLSDKARYRYLLTGTPILNGLEDLYGLFRVLDGGESLGRTLAQFRGEFLTDLNSGMNKESYWPNWVVKNNEKPRLQRLQNAKSMTKEKKDCLDLPPLVKTVIPVEMSPAQRKAYVQMEKELVAYMGDKACVAELAITKALRLQQIVTGHMAVEDQSGKQTIVTFKDNPRKAILQDLLKDLVGKHKIIIWSVFKENYKDIRDVCEKMSVNYVEYHGEVKAKDKQPNIDAFNDDPNVRVFIGNPQSGGSGINLISSNVTIFYSRNFSLEHDLQAEARNYRGGSEIHEKVTRYDLITPDTIDEKVQQALAQKFKIGYDFLHKEIKG